MFFRLLHALPLAALITLAWGECDMTYTSSGVGTKITEPAICLSQGAGSYTFAMVSSLSSLGLTDSTVGSSGFLIMDNTCTMVGGYTQPRCGVPWTIKANFLKDIMTIETVQESVGGGSFKFKYGNGDYSIGNNGCVCNSIASAPNTAETGCRCAFPVNGIKKRSLQFKA